MLGDKMVGECPKCGSVNLEYGSFAVEEEQGYYYVTCRDCGFVGEEWYSMEFIEYRDKEGNSLDSTKVLIR